MAKHKSSFHKALELGRKLYRMSLSENPGESLNAKFKLEILMKRHGLNILQIIESEYKEYNLLFKYQEDTLALAATTFLTNVFVKDTYHFVEGKPFYITATDRAYTILLRIVQDLVDKQGYTDLQMQQQRGG